jgi:hypothetical protein
VTVCDYTSDFSVILKKHFTVLILITIIIIVQFNYLFLCAASKAESPITDTTQTNVFHN